MKRILALLCKRSPRVQSGHQCPWYNGVCEAMIDAQHYARSHGGDVQLVDVTEDGEVRVKLRGACAFCPLSSVTIKVGVEAQLKLRVPEVRKVVVV